MRIDGLAALETLASENERAFYPEQDDARTRNGALFADVRPGFTFDRGSRVFTIGSCFARNIEEHLTDYDLPTLRFSVPQDEWSRRPNGLLNEHNVGTIAQRIERAIAGRQAPADTVVLTAARGFVDLLVVGGTDASRERTFERRREIDEIYTDLPRSDVVIVTLGMVEAWVDNRSGTYLNRMPPTRRIRKNPRRYSVEIFDVKKAQSLLERSLRLLTDRGIKVVLLVSAVPLRATFSGEDVVVANSYSKAVLRVCAQRLAATLPGVDYFPAYEIVTSGGLQSYEEDNRHVRDDVVGEFVRFLLERYEAPAPAVAALTDAAA
jgi:GSCFA family